MKNNSNNAVKNITSGEKNWNWKFYAW